MTNEDEVIAEAKAHAKSQMDRAEAIGRANQREQTAATILAALTEGRMVGKGGTLDDADLDNARYAVALADTLRAELSKGESSMHGQREQERR